MKYPYLSANIEGAAALLDALASENRLHILRRLTGGEVSAGALAPEIGISQPALSQQLTKLRKLGLVRVRREAQTIYYWCDNAAVKTLLRTVSNLPDPNLQDG